MRWAGGWAATFQPCPQGLLRAVQVAEVPDRTCYGELAFLCWAGGGWIGVVSGQPLDEPVFRRPECDLAECKMMQLVNQCPGLTHSRQNPHNVMEWNQRTNRNGPEEGQGPEINVQEMSVFLPKCEIFNRESIKPYDILGIEFYSHTLLGFIREMCIFTSHVKFFQWII